MTDSGQQIDQSASVSSVPPTPPMTGSVMARLFIVPALIVCLLLAVAVVVVLFGSSSMDKQETVADLITRLESDTGERTLGAMLMPKAKESWQAAQELAQRFAHKEKFLKPDEIGPAATRIVALLAKFPPGQDVEEDGPAQQYFLMMALGRLGTDSGVEALTKLLKDPNWSTRRTALQSFAEMRGEARVKQSLPSILAMLDDPRPAVQMVACATVAATADRGDSAAIRALAAKLDGDKEVQWNAAMALARLGDLRGKLALMNMLDRGYWEKLDLEYNDRNTLVRRKYSDLEVANNLRAAIDAASQLNDAELAAMIAKLQNDPAVLVRDAAHGAVSRAATKETVMKKAEASSNARWFAPSRGLCVACEGEVC